MFFCEPLGPYRSSSVSSKSIQLGSVRPSSQFAIRQQQDLSMSQSGFNLPEGRRYYMPWHKGHMNCNSGPRSGGSFRAEQNVLRKYAKCLKCRLCENILTKLAPYAQTKNDADRRRHMMLLAGPCEINFSYLSLLYRI